MTRHGEYIGMTKQEYKRAWYARHPALRAKQHADLKIRCGEVTSFIQAYKEGKVCALCGEDDVKRLLFHHCDPTIKKFNLGRARGRPVRIELILEEIDKCVLWCRACHCAYHNPAKN
jgi:hypothetical protein